MRKNCHKTVTVTPALPVVIPASVYTIGEEAFNLCEKLTSVTIKGTVVLLSFGAFANCTALSGLNIPPGDAVFRKPYDFDEEQFYGCSKLPPAMRSRLAAMLGEEAFGAELASGGSGQKADAWYQRLLLRAELARGGSGGGSAQAGGTASVQSAAVTPPEAPVTVDDFIVELNKAGNEAIIIGFRQYEVPPVI
jgi:hypothetical protein